MKQPETSTAKQDGSPALAPVSGSGRTREENLRPELYKAATAYAQYIMGDEINYEKAMRVAQELEDAADAFADR